ncbi:hypothetical protein DMC30DRAFT_390234 [Rhodotorula diobovata]|uniref:Zn(2)-C6 fungal-type domain-containing protein n=1 Tax=Rhodotorula diobovata TaxID=5288 RepID=A0A5C5G2R7_9BASI|nr:hypothetical protein DMC30DRAFT_390234 [Rhodotorula diobovata]
MASRSCFCFSPVVLLCGPLAMPRSPTRDGPLAPQRRNGSLTGRASSCQECRSRKARCSRTANCERCRLQGIPCVWVEGTFPRCASRRLASAPLRRS